ncbi:TAF4-domain-containing protein, partial [Basidiobolus meristosporus CBS 931.73]
RPAAVAAISRPSTPVQASPMKDNKVDFDTLTDVMGYVGVDLKEESDNIMRQSEIMDKNRAVDIVDQSKTQDFLSLRVLKSMVDKIAKPYHIPNIDPDFLVYLALATQDRLKSLVEQMIVASKHRVRSHHLAPPPIQEDTNIPLYKIVVSDDVKKQLLSLERVSREDECKRKRILAERERRLAEENAKAENKEESGDMQKSKKVRRKDGLDLPGAARNMNDANTTALLIAGGVRRSWMLAEPTGSGSAKSATSTPKSSKPIGNPPASGSGTSSALPNNPSSSRFAPVQKPLPHSSKAAVKSGGASHGSTPKPGSKSRLVLPPSTVNHPSIHKCTNHIPEGDKKDTNLGNGERVLLKGPFQM